MGDYDDELNNDDFVQITSKDRREVSAEFRKMSINEVMNMSPSSSQVYAEGLSKSG